MIVIQFGSKNAKLWIPTGYEPAVRTDWLDGHGVTGEGREQAASDATKDVEGMRVRSATHIRSKSAQGSERMIGVPDVLGPVMY